MVAFFALTVGVPGAIAAQTTISARGASLVVGGRLHSQYYVSSVDGANADFFTRRARLIVDGSFTPFVSGRIQYDLAGNSPKLVDAYARLNFSSAFRVSFGQFKRAFDLFELSSSTDLSVFERTGQIMGYDMCTGVGRLCSYSRLTEGLSYSDRDKGIKIDGSSGQLTYQATMTNGTGLSGSDENDAKSFAGRVSLAATDDVTVSANGSLHDYVDPTDSNEYAFAWGGDVQVGSWRNGLLVQAAFVSGDNWKSLDAMNVPGAFTTAQVAISYYAPLDGDRIIGVEPIARMSVADPDDGIVDDGGLLFTPGVMFYFLGKNKVGVNLDYYAPSMGDGVWTFRTGTFLYF